MAGGGWSLQKVIGESRTRKKKKEDLEIPWI